MVGSDFSQLSLLTCLRIDWRLYNSLIRQGQMSSLDKISVNVLAEKQPKFIPSLAIDVLLIYLENENLQLHDVAPLRKIRSLIRRNVKKFVTGRKKNTRFVIGIGKFHFRMEF